VAEAKMLAWLVDGADVEPGTVLDAGKYVEVGPSMIDEVGLGA